MATHGRIVAQGRAPQSESRRGRGAADTPKSAAENALIDGAIIIDEARAQALHVLDELERDCLAAIAIMRKRVIPGDDLARFRALRVLDELERDSRAAMGVLRQRINSHYQFARAALRGTDERRAA